MLLELALSMSENVWKEKMVYPRGMQGIGPGSNKSPVSWVVERPHSVQKATSLIPVGELETFLQTACTVELLLMDTDFNTDTSLLRTVHSSERDKNSFKLYLGNTDTFTTQRFLPVPLVSLLRRVDCIINLLLIMAGCISTVNNIETRQIIMGKIPSTGKSGCILLISFNWKKPLSPSSNSIQIFPSTSFSSGGARNNEKEIRLH